MSLTMENTIDKIEECIDDLAELLNKEPEELKTILEPHLPKVKETVVTPEFLEQLNKKLVGKVIRDVKSYHKFAFIKIKKITYIGITKAFVIHGNVICSSNDLKIGTKTVSFYVDQQCQIQPKGEININCLDDLIVNDTEEIKKLMNSELNYMRLVSSHFYE